MAWTAWPCVAGVVGREAHVALSCDCSGGRSGSSRCHSLPVLGLMRHLLQGKQPHGRSIMRCCMPVWLLLRVQLLLPWREGSCGCWGSTKRMLRPEEGTVGFVALCERANRRVRGRHLWLRVCSKC